MLVLILSRFIFAFAHSLMFNKIAWPVNIPVSIKWNRYWAGWVLKFCISSRESLKIKPKLASLGLPRRWGVEGQGKKKKILNKLQGSRFHGRKWILKREVKIITQLCCRFILGLSVESWRRGKYIYDAHVCIYTCVMHCKLRDNISF